MALPSTVKWARVLKGESPNEELTRSVQSGASLISGI